MILSTRSSHDETRPTRPDPSSSYSTGLRALLKICGEFDDVAKGSCELTVLSKCENPAGRHGCSIALLKSVREERITRERRAHSGLDGTGY